MEKTAKKVFAFLVSTLLNSPVVSEKKKYAPREITGSSVYQTIKKSLEKDFQGGKLTLKELAKKYEVSYTSMKFYKRVYDGKEDNPYNGRY